MHGDSTFAEALADLFDGGWIDEVLYEVKSGKEATVFCCRAGARSLERLSELSPPRSAAAKRPLPPGEGRSEGRSQPSPHERGQGEGSSRLPLDTTPAGGTPAPPGMPLLAAKVYRDLSSRRFKNDAIYQAGRIHLAREGRIKRAADNKSHFGRQVQYAMWIEHEWETLHVLHEAGLDVPAPIARSERAILMTYLGDEAASAPALAEIDLPRDQAWDTLDRLLDTVFAMLRVDRVHGDLSPYNILWWNGRATIIDFPQSIDPRLNPAARTLLARDVENLCRWAARQGVPPDASSPAAAERITRTMWGRFRVGERLS